MSLFGTFLTSIPTCYATVSIGSDSNPLKQKLEVIAAAGFQGTELGFPPQRYGCARFLQTL